MHLLYNISYYISTTFLLEYLYFFDVLVDFLSSKCYSSDMDTLKIQLACSTTRLPLYELTETLKVSHICKFYSYNYNRNFIGHPERHDAYEIFYVVTGSIKAKINGKSYIFRQNELVIVPPMAWHQMSANNDICSSWACIFVSSPLPDYILENKMTLTKTQQSVLYNIGTEYIDNLPNDGYFFFDTNAPKRKQNNYAYLQTLKIQLEYFLILLIRTTLQLRSEHEFKQNETSKAAMFKQSVVSYINEHLNEVLFTSQIAEHFHYSTAHFSRTFKKIMGETVSTYIQRAKIQKSILMIAENTYTLQEISDSLNFGTIQYFSKIFKRYTGVAPSEFRKNCRVTNLLSTLYLMNDIK